MVGSLVVAVQLYCCLPQVMMMIRFDDRSVKTILTNSWHIYQIPAMIMKRPIRRTLVEKFVDSTLCDNKLSERPKEKRMDVPQS